MENEKGLTLKGMSGRNFLFILNAAVMVGVSIYLTTHFYEARYPTTLGGGKSLCDISNYFNCDTATFSKISNLAGVPISFFGIIVGLLFIFSSLMPSENMEKTANAVARYNFIGCVGLFIFSLVGLGALCPMCTVYYVLSGIAFFLLWRFGIPSWVPDLKVTALWGALLLIGSFFMYKTTEDKERVKNSLNSSVVDQFRKLQDFGDPDVESPYKVHLATPNFADSPIRISVFSDFECPFCAKVAEQLPEIIRRYPKQVSIQYLFYPLDSKCNPNIQGNFHQNACDAAMLAACDEKKFLEVHDEIFAHQSELGSGIIQTLAKKYNLNNCFTDDIKNKVISTINQGAKYKLKSTPTVIVNGKKIEGSIPNNQFFAIFEDILKGGK
jgi:protein-disulfide isomerase/uncharacterized membrane protein